MEKLNKHIINKVFLEVNTNSKEKAYYLKDNINMFVRDELLLMLENYFDALDQKNPLYSIQIEKLDLEFSLHPNLSFDDFKKEIIYNVKQQLEKQIDTSNAKTENFKLIKNEEKIVNHFFAFLETGIHPWWHISKKQSEIDDYELEKIIGKENFIKKLLEIFNKPIDRSRFIKQFSDDQIIMILKKGLLAKINLENELILESIKPEDSSSINKKLNSILKKILKIDLQKIKDNVKTIVNVKHRNLAWDIIILELNKNINKNEDKNVTKQKLFYLIYMLVKSNLKVKNKIHNDAELIKEISIQIGNRNTLEIITNLEKEIFEIEKKTEKLNPNKQTFLTQSEIDDQLKFSHSNAQTIESKSNKIIEPNNDIQQVLKDNSKNNISAETKALENDGIKNDKSIENQELNIKDAAEKDGIKNDKSIENQELNINNEDLTTKEINLKDIIEIEKIINEETIIQETPANYYIENAGLILVHPFLIHLFKNCNLIEKDNTFNNPELAVHLLHYIATGKEQDYEDTMVFEKFLCNVSPQQPINRNITLSDEMKNQGNEMLKAVLQNWEIMKKSSIDLLRNEYLQRSGKIILTENNPKIIIERKTQDILLDKISWNLGIIKLTWKDKIIYVDW